MVETKLIMKESKDEFHQIMEHIRKGENFLLSGGAGSGKTYTLVQVIKQVIIENPTTKVACMTYTNAAVKEIEERVNHKHLNVTTIHDFIWDTIKYFQNELKIVLIDLINNDDISKIKLINDEKVEVSFYNEVESIEYSYQRTQLIKGIISHDELLIVANAMFEKYPKLCDILKDKFKFIFVDEYQDTHKEVVQIFLEFLTKSKKQNVIGFFGDAMQSIYDTGVGNLDNYKGDEVGKVKEVKKVQNRRNPLKIITLANKLRTDRIQQEPSQDLTAPNMLPNGEPKEGNIKFIYSTDDNLEKVKSYLDWNFENTKDIKELNLTHNLIAGKAEFRSLMDIYDKDPIIGLKNDILKRIKENREKGRPEVEIEETNTFDQVVDKFELRTKKVKGEPIAKLKKDIILEKPENILLYNQLKDKLFAEVKKIYLDKKHLIDDKKQDKDEESKKGSERDNLIKHLFRIQKNIFLYNNNQYNDFLRITDYKITNIKHKRNLKNSIEEVTNVADKTIADVITDADAKGICLIDEKLEKFKIENEYTYNRVKNVKFSEFQKLYDYLEGFTPFSTQHKVKGDEFNNVLVVLDNGKWFDYNFEKLFLNTGTPSVLERTQKIFYVCCTRAKEKLAVYYHNPNVAVIEKAKEWFEEDNVINLDLI